jgi:hypothetical protein
MLVLLFIMGRVGKRVYKEIPGKEESRIRLRG